MAVTTNRRELADRLVVFGWRLIVTICVLASALGYVVHGAEHGRPLNTIVAFIAALGALGPVSEAFCALCAAILRARLDDEGKG